MYEKPDELTATIPKPTFHKQLKNILYWSLLVIIVAVSTAIIYTQNHKIKTLNSSNSGLVTDNKKVTAENTKLTTMNSNLTTTVKALKNSQTKTSSTEVTPSTTSTIPAKVTNSPISCSPPAQMTGSFAIDCVQILTPGYFESTSIPSTAQLFTVFFTIKNLSSSTQTYTIYNFQGITDTGALVNPVNYSAPGDGNIWNNSSVLAGGTLSQTIIFNPGTNLVSVQFTPDPTGSTPIILPMPSIQTQ